MFFRSIHSPHSSTLGTWRAGVPADMDFDIAMLNAKRVYKIVTVIQPPFMQWNETLRKETNCYLFF